MYPDNSEKLIGIIQEVPAMMNSIKGIIKLFLSDFLIRKLTGISYGWHGNYKSWQLAQKKCTGYHSETILKKVLETARRVRDKEIPYERDSVAFEKIEYSFPVLASLLLIAERNKKLNIIDFGGSLGSSYYQNRDFLSHLPEFNWCIVEQAHFVKTGKEEFSNKFLHFYNTIKECTEKHTIDGILLSGVLQYLENPYDFIREVMLNDIEYIIIDRTLFLPGEKERITIQKVPGKIYKAEYSCRLLSEKKMNDIISTKYELIYDFDVPGTINIKSLYKGYFFRRKNS